MKPIVRLGYLAAACALLVTTFAIIGPRTVHAIVATLVQVVNTSANPAITQDISGQASQIVTLFINDNGNSFLINAAGVVSNVQYSVPVGQVLVITSIDVTPASHYSPGAAAFILEGLIGQYTNTFETFAVPTSQQTWIIAIRPGIAMGAGTSPFIGDQFGVPSVSITLHGYLTPF